MIDICWFLIAVVNLFIVMLADLTTDEKNYHMLWLVLAALVLGQHR